MKLFPNTDSRTRQYNFSGREYLSILLITLCFKGKSAEKSAKRKTPRKKIDSSSDEEEYPEEDEADESDEGNNDKGDEEQEHENVEDEGKAKKQGQFLVPEPPSSTRPRRSSRR